MDPRMVQRRAAEQWYEEVSKMEAGDQVRAFLSMSQIATAGVQVGMAKFVGKTIGGAAVNTALGGAPITIMIWSELRDGVTSDDPVYSTCYALNEMFNPVHIAGTRGEAFFEAMQDFQFEEAGEDLAEAEVAVAATVAASVPEAEAGAAKGPPNPYGKLGKP